MNKKRHQIIIEWIVVAASSRYQLLTINVLFASTYVYLNVWNLK